MPKQLTEVVILPGGRMTIAPVIPENQTATWEHILIALQEEPAEGQKTAEEK